MNKTIVVKLPVVWLFVIAVLLAAVLLGTGAATSDKKEDSWAITAAPNGVYVLNEQSGNLYLLPESQTSIGSKSKLKKIVNLRDEKGF